MKSTKTFTTCIDKIWLGDPASSFTGQLCFVLDGYNVSRLDSHVLSLHYRYHEAGKTKIREVDMKAKGLEPKTCQKIVGFDANGLYLSAIMKDMPTGNFTRRREETGFKKESSVKMATEWLEWESHSRRIPIRHQINDTEKRIGTRRLPVDGFHGPSQTVFQFHGKFSF